MPERSDDDAETPALRKHPIEHGRYTAGVSGRYAPSVLTGDGAHQHRAPGFGIGTRFHSAPVVRIFDARPMQLGHAVEADGRWRGFVFAGEETRPGGLFAFLADDPASPLRRFTPRGADADGVIDLRAVFPDHHELDPSDLPPLLTPRKGRHGLIDHEKVPCADHRPGQDVCEMRGLGRAQGFVVIVRPDQYVAQVLPLDGHEELAAFFAGVLLPAACT